MFKTKKMAAQYFRKILDRVTKHFESANNTEAVRERPANREMISKLLGPFESYIISLQSLLIWDKPYLSATALFILNIAYWILVSCSRRLLSLLAILWLIIFLYRAWIYQIWPEIRVPPSETADSEGWTPIHPQVYSVPELSQLLNQWWSSMCGWWEAVWTLRQNQPGMFCSILCVAFTCLAFLGHIVPGVLLIYLVVLVVTFGPGLALHVIPSTWWTKQEPVDADFEYREFLPSSLDLTNEQQQEGLLDNTSILAKELGIESLLSEADEQEDSLSRGLGSFPNVEEEGSEDEMVAETGLDLPAMLMAASTATSILNAVTSQAPTASSSSAEKMNAAGAIHFVTSHFKEPSSDDSDNEDDPFIEGLSFSKTLQSEIQVMESSLSRPLSLATKKPSLTKKRGIEASGNQDSQLTTPSSDLDISEYELVSESELSS